MQRAEDAVLVSEHQNAIKLLNGLKAKGIDPETMDNGLLNNKIIQANKAILFLDQKGKKTTGKTLNMAINGLTNKTRTLSKYFAHSANAKIR